MTPQGTRNFLIASVIIVALLIGYGFTQIQSQQRSQKVLITEIKKEAKDQGDLAVRVAAITKSNLDNRAKNGGTLCNAINANRIELKRIAPGWQLMPLNCKALETATIKSGEPIPAPAGVSK